LEVSYAKLFLHTNRDITENSDINLYIRKKDTREALEYILCLLNSKLLNYWMEYKGREKGVSRQIRLQNIPIRRIDFDKPEDVHLHDEIVENAKGIREKMAKLSSYSKYFKGTRLTRLKSEAPLPDLNLEAIVRSLPPEKKFSLRTHPAIRIAYSPGFQDAELILRKVGEASLTLEGAELELYGKDRKVLYINGEEKLLKIITQILKNYQKEHWTSIKETPFVPQNSEEFEAKKQDILDTVSNLRAQIQKLQDLIDTMVFGLYGVPEGLSVNKSISYS